MYRLKNFGIRNEETVDSVGANAKMNEFQASMGICNLRHVEDEIKKREELVKGYRNYLDGIQGIQVTKEQKNVKSNYAYFPILVDEEQVGVSRDVICESLKKKGIYTRKYFYPLTNTFDCYAGKFDINNTPIALDISKKVLTLPLYADLSMDDVKWICKEIIKLKKREEL